MATTTSGESKKLKLGMLGFFYIFLEGNLSTNKFPWKMLMQCLYRKGMDLVSKVTALEVDVANCFLDLSLVVWSMDAEQMLTYHRQIWEMMDHTKALDNTDFRVPTEGAMWGGMWTDAD